jgi:rhodanese-related sulfurtransferase
VHESSTDASAVRSGDITPAELSRLLNSGHPVAVIDVRESDEWEFARIPTARLMPLATLPEAAAGIDLNTEVVVYCHHGVRSEMAAHDLVAAGFRRVRNLVGGIDRWSREVDTEVPRYR